MGRQGSIAVVERAILTIKTLLALLPEIPLWREGVDRELVLLVGWYGEH